MYNFFTDVFTIVWIGYIAVAVAVMAMLFIFRTKREGPKLIVREEGEVRIPVFTIDDKGGDDVYTVREQRRCKYCGKKIRNDRWFCCLDHKKKYLRRKK